MRITVLGAGAMGCLFGAYLSQANNVTLVDTDPAKIAAIHAASGVRVREADGFAFTTFIQAYTPEWLEGREKAELLIVFVKSMYERKALEGVKPIIGPDTYIMSLQNGAGHEETMLEFADPDHVIIGTTQDNSSVIEYGYVNHGGYGKTYIGSLGNNSEQIKKMASMFTDCGFDTAVSDDVRSLIWRKLFQNASGSVLTGALDCTMEFITESHAAWQMAETLVDEAVTVANAAGMSFDPETIKAEVKANFSAAKGGKTSIYSDLEAGRKTEVDYISGMVSRTGKSLGIPTPGTDMMISFIHALEDKSER